MLKYQYGSFYVLSIFFHLIFIAILVLTQVFPLKFRFRFQTLYLMLTNNIADCNDLFIYKA